MNDKLKIREKIGYGFGDGASSMFWKIFTIYLPIFYTDVFGISAAAVGTMLLVTRIWDTANDPIMGVVSDRTNTRWGKFRPYLLWISVPFGIAGVLLFTTPDFGYSGKLIYAYCTYTLMMMVYTAINVPYASLLGVATANSNDRTTLASYRMVFAFGGSLLVVAIYQPIVDFFKADMAETRSYQMTMIIIGVLAVVFFLLAFAWTRERITPPKSQKNNLKKDLKNLLNNGPWFILLGAGVMTILFNTIRDGVALYYFKYFIIDETAIAFSKMTFTFSTLYLFIGQGANMLGVIFAKTISSKLGKKQTFVSAMVGAAVFSVLFLFIGKGEVIQIYTLQIVVSFCAGIVLPLLWSMYADSADWSEWKTGRRATGLVFSASSMTQKLGWTLGGAVTLWLLAAYGFKANVDQSAETIKGIKYMMSILPAAAALCSGIFIYFYQLSDKKMKQIAAELQQKEDNMIRLNFILLLVLSLSAYAQKPMPSDKKATKETVKLYQNLLKIKKEGIMFGHQDALAYGEGWYGEEGRSDVKSVCGDYPAVYGWEIGHLELGDKYSLDSVGFKDIQQWIKTAYNRGGVNTISWHLRNPYTGGSSWDTSSDKVVASILPGGEKHDLYVEWLDKLAVFFKGLKTDNGTFIPILFRPFHEHSGSWFWWGKNLCSVEDYIALWHFTVSYLQNEKGIHHLLYTYSTDRFETQEDYLERYPGDEYIDILGFDLYDRGPYYSSSLKNCAEKVSRLAVEKGKIATVSETGGPINKNHQWWTHVLNILRPYELSYVLVWRNPFRPTDHANFAPYKGSPDSDDFVKFYKDGHTFFQNEILNKMIYK